MSGVFGELGEKFRKFLSSYQQVQLQFNPQVTPVIDALELHREPIIFNTPETAVTGTGVFLITNNSGKTLRCTHLQIQLNSGTFTFSTVHIWDGRNPVKMKTWNPSVTDETYEPINPILLYNGWSLRVYVDTHAVNGTIFARLFATEETALA